MHPFDTINLPTGGKFLLTPCPGTKEASLNESFSTLKNQGAEILITMMTQTELEKYSVTSIPDLAKDYDMQWFHFPVKDDCAPEMDTQNKINDNIETLKSAITDKKTIAMHCKGGQGRTGLIAAILLLEYGLKWNEVKTLIQSVKPRSLTLTPHLDYIESKYN